MSLSSSQHSAAWELHNLRNAAFEGEFDSSLAGLTATATESDFVLDVTWSSDSAGEEKIPDHVATDSDMSDSEVLADTFLYSKQKRDEPEPEAKAFELLLRLGETTTVSKEEELQQTKAHYEKLVDNYGQQFRRLHDTLKNKHTRFQKQHKQLKASGAATLPAASLNAQRKLRDHKKRRPAMRGTTKLKEAKRETVHIRLERSKRKADADARARVKQRELKEPRMPDKECVIDDCTMRAMRPADYCYAHITNDPDQVLFQGCQFPNETGELCNYPILATRDPPICNGHIDLLTEDGKRTDLRMTKKEKREREEDLKISRVTFSTAKSVSVNKCYERIIDLLIEVQTMRKKISASS